MKYLAILAISSVGCMASAQSVVETDNIVYTSASGAPQNLDLYQPTTGANHPAIVFIHGGGWDSGSKDGWKYIAERYVAEGYVCIAINYRLAPQYVWPAQLDDAQAAVRWLRKNADSLGVDTTRIAAFGSSAGGHLALFLGEKSSYKDFDPDLSGYSPKVQAMIDYSGPTDLRNQHDWPDLWQDILHLIGSTYSQGNLAYASASPVLFASATTAPAIVFQGGADPIVPREQSERMVSQLLANHTFIEYHEFANEGHEFSNQIQNFSYGFVDFFLYRTFIAGH